MAADSVVVEVGHLSVGQRKRWLDMAKSWKEVGDFAFRILAPGGLEFMECSSFALS